MDETDIWITSMLSLGYVPGPEFSSYEELSAWDGGNTRPHVRRLIDGKYKVYFTDYQSHTEDTPTDSNEARSGYDIIDVPF